MTCPRCKCHVCRAAAVNAVLGKVAASRETETYDIGPAITHDLPIVDAHNARLLQQSRDQSAWWDTVGEDAR